MTFSKFANIVFRHIGKGAKKGDFVKALFQQIIVLNGEDNPLDDYEAPAYRAFLRNDREISKLARSIMDILEPECFVKYLNDVCSDEQAANLTYEFSEKGYLVNLETFSEDIAGIFRQIIPVAAAGVIVRMRLSGVPISCSLRRSSIRSRLCCIPVNRSLFMTFMCRMIYL